MPVNDSNPLNPDRRKPHATLDVHGGGTSPFPSPSASPDGCPRVELIEGSGQDLTDETRVLLRTRLRAAALVFCLGSMAFLLRDFFTTRETTLDGALASHEKFLSWFQAIHVGVMALVSYKLCSKCDLSLRWLRVAETLIFGLTALFFVAVQHCATLVATHLGYVFNPVALWYALMFTYAIYIPNSGRRAAIILGFMAIAPISCFLIDRATYPTFGKLTTFDSVSGMTLMISIGFFSSAYGAHMIGSLRRQAYEAKQLGQYKLGELIGAGGMGEVYLAEHQMMKRPCAIKVIRPNKARDPRALARFEREVRATAKLSHWNTVEIFDYGRTDDGTFYYVMEYLPGLSISELVERHGPLAPERVIYLLEQTCDALREAHAAGLVHRDIKPGNIFAAIRGGVYDVAKLLDFGLAKAMVDDSSVQLTQEGMITGSPLFMSPEQAIGDTEPDARSDIYSLGAVAYYMLTGRPPFQSDKPMKVMIAHAHDDPPPPSQFRPDLPADLERVVLRSLAKNPAERYENAGAFARDLASCDSAGGWTRDHAANWWTQVGQPLVVGA
ncbi:MAG TPA: serine/threonine-protein kinase [Pirellulales bacterium]|jgi:serine/threonine-protein kinase